VISVIVRRGMLTGVHLGAQLKAGMMYQAMKARIARTMITIAVYLIAANPAGLEDSGPDCGYDRRS